MAPPNNFTGQGNFANQRFKFIACLELEQYFHRDQFCLKICISKSCLLGKNTMPRLQEVFEL